MTDEDKFMDDEKADAAVEDLRKEICAALVRCGKGPLKSMVVIAHLDDGAFVHADGCLCRSCKTEILSALGQSFGARATLVGVQAAAKEDPAVH